MNDDAYVIVGTVERPAFVFAVMDDPETGERVRVVFVYAADAADIALRNAERIERYLAGADA